MAFQGNQRVYANSVGTTSKNSTWLDTRDPTAYDVNFSVGQLWQNTTDANLWFLNSFSSTSGNLQADWQSIDTASTDAVLTINNISANSSGNFTLTAGENITLTPGSNAITISSSEVEGVSLFVVDSQGNAGYTTIQDALTAAQAVATENDPQTVWIWPGTYSGDIDLFPWVNLASASGGVIITGNVFYTSTDDETISLTNIRFSPSSGDCFEIDGEGVPIFIFNSCIFDPTAGNVYTWENTDGSAAGIPATYFNNCILTGVGAFKVFNIIGCPVNSRIVLTATSWVATVSSTASDVIFDINQCTYQDSFVGTGCFFLFSNSSATNIGSIPHFNIDGTSTLFVTTSSFIGIPTHLVTGTGTVLYDLIGNAGGNAAFDSGLTVTAYQSLSGGISFDNGTTRLNTDTQGTIHQVLLGTGTSAVSVVSGTGTTGQLLTSQGASADPIWTSPAADITQVGDVTSGAAFSGTQGSILQGISQTSGTSPGGNLTIKAGSPWNLASSVLAGNLNLSTGGQQGSVAKPLINLLGSSVATGGGASPSNTGMQRIVTNASSQGLVSGTPVNILSFTLDIPFSNPSTSSGTIFYSFDVIDADPGNFQTVMGQVNFVSAFNGTTIVNDISSPYAEISAVSSGTISTAWSITTSGKTGTVVMTPTTSLSVGTVLTASWTLISNSSCQFTIIQ